MSKILGQVAPNAGEEWLLYQVPSKQNASLTSLIICNRGNADDRFTVRIMPNGATLGDKHYVYYLPTIRPNDTYSAEHLIKLGPGDQVYVKSTLGTLSFSAFGDES